MTLLISLPKVTSKVEDRERRMACQIFEIRLRGSLSPRLREAFAAMDVVTETVLRGPVEDQAALYGVLERIRDLGIELVEVHCTQPGDEAAS